MKTSSKTTQIAVLANALDVANEAYRKGESLQVDLTVNGETYQAGTELHDSVYESWVDELRTADPKNPILDKVGHKLDDSDPRKDALPIIMASMGKMKDMDDYRHWLKSKNISSNTLMVVGPKWDGLSFCVKEGVEDENQKPMPTRKAWTRGDKNYGQRSDAWLEKMNDGTRVVDASFVTFGEIIISRKKFEKYDISNGGVYKFARGMVAGKLRDEKVDAKVMKDVDYIRYGMEGLDISRKSMQLDYLNTLNAVKTPYKMMLAGEITEEKLLALYKVWNVDYAIDGLIIEVDDMELRDQLGRETSSENPCYARAFKSPKFDEVKETTVTDLVYLPSKSGSLVPVIHVEPTTIDGVTIARLLVDNHRWVMRHDLGIGSKVGIKRSGSVIPRVATIEGIPVLKPEEIGKKEFKNPNPKFNSLVRHDGLDVTFDGVHANYLYPERSPEVRLQKVIAFFEILGVENVSDKTFRFMFERGYDTLDRILAIERSEMASWNGWGDRKAEIVYSSIHSKLKSVEPHMLKHASGCFEGLGSSKLGWVAHLPDDCTVADVMKVDGFAEPTAKTYVDGLKKFAEWRKQLPEWVLDNAKPIEAEVKGEKCKGWIVVFTGFRDKNLERLLAEQGGSTASSVSGRTTHLVMKQKGSGSSKEKKAQDLGINILDKKDIEGILGVNENAMSLKF